MTVFQQFRIWLRRASRAQQVKLGVSAALVVSLLGYAAASTSGGGKPSSASLSSFGSGSSFAPSGTAGGADQSAADPAAAALPGGAAETQSTDTASPPGSAAVPAPGAVGAATQVPVSSTTAGSTQTATAPVSISPSTKPRAAASAAALKPGAATKPGATKPTAGASATAAASASAAASKQCPAGADQGVTATAVNVTVTLVDIAGTAGNSAVNVPSPAEQQQDFQTVANDINAHGGAGCRKLALSFKAVNPVDAAGAQQDCLSIADSKPFVTIDTGALTAANAEDCLPQQQIPLLTHQITIAQVKQYYPYYFSLGDAADNASRAGFLALGKSGYFSQPNLKLGFLYDDCTDAIITIQKKAIRDAGVPDSALVPYNLGCPASGYSSPSAIEQAVLTFQQDNVTSVTTGYGTLGDFTNFTKVAQGQGFKPKYLLANDEVEVATVGASGADATNLDGAVNMTDSAFAESATPGFKPSAATSKCDALFTSQGLKPTYQQSDGFGGVACDYLGYLAQLLDHAPQLSRASLVNGVTGIGVQDSAYPFGYTDYAASGQGATFGRSYLRPDAFVASCGCWRVTNPTWNAPLS